MPLRTRVAILAAAWTVLVLIGSGQYLFEQLRRGIALDVTAAIHGATLYFTPWVPLVWSLQRVSTSQGLRQQRHTSALLIVTVTVLSAALTQLLCRRALSLATGWETHRSLVELATSHLYLNVVVGTVVVAIAQSLAAWRRARERENDARRMEAQHARTEAQLARSELHRLQQQLQPHFLFNALNAISEVMHHDVDTADRALDALSALLREAVAAAGLQRWPLRRELVGIEQYLSIQQLRFGSRLNVRTAVADGTADAHVPPFLLQPLVENAIEHAVAKRRHGARVEIVCRTDGPSLRIEVKDDGAGAEGAQPREGTGVGLSMTRTRLLLLYGSHASLEVHQNAILGTTAVIALPLEYA